MITSCDNAQTNTVSQNQIESTTGNVTEVPDKVDTQKNTENTPAVNQTSGSNQANINKTQPVANKQPEIFTVKELVTGDIICYATVVDEKGVEHRRSTSFEICAESEKYLNKKVRASYEIASLNDCESIEPCGKSRQESIISKMEILDEKTSSNTQTHSNGKWRITIGNRDSWTGVNNTGNLTYKGCDAKGNCISLTGGKVSCRRGECVMGWVNGDYRYIWSQAITEDANASPTLIVKKGDTEILKAIGFKPVPVS
ncbi:hypothetical protein [Anabaena sp. CCY 9402-a]|uniref:hypothetical protein n=1 Tax=Anabaena sp. CCY 9402-a TaxID=3103867 RepID=UPI0039C6C146